MTESHQRGKAAVQVAFDAATNEGRAALIPYLTAGFPSRSSTLSLLTAAAKGGADVIELGIPFSDPIADGPVIQHSSQIALAGGFRVADAFEALAAFRREWSTPVIVFSYLNPLLAMGGRMAERLVASGADGALLVDLSFEDGAPLRAELEAAELAHVPLFAPTTSEQRMKAIAAEGSGFLYVVSMTGVTGQHLTAFEAVQQRVATLRSVSGLPVAVGFGVRTPDDARAVASFADGVVVGTELVRRVERAGPDAAAETVEAYVRKLRAGTVRHAASP